MTLRSLVARSPLSLFGGVDPFVALARDLDKAFSPLAERTAPVASFGTDVKLDVTENDRAVTITAECPGVDEKDIDLSFSEGVLTLKGDKKFERDEKTETLHLIERSYGSFSRQIAIPSDIDAAKIEASFVKGVLTVTLPKQAKTDAETRKIAIKATT
jgi:HSP20 family protein